ncbi:MAG: PQQ-binding-like beta-propeller repeat protein [Chitinivibrionales bacterium]
MKCDEFKKSCELYVLGGLSDMESAAARLHLRQCAGCKQREQEYRGIIFGLRPPGEPEVPPQRLEAIEAAVCKEIAEIASPYRHQKPRFVFRAAALMLVALTGGLVAFMVAGYGQKSPLHSLASSRPHTLPSQTNLRKLWSIDCGAGYRSTAAHKPIISRGVVFTLTADKQMDRLVAVGGDSGNRLWSSERHCYGYLSSGEGKVFAVCNHPQGAGVQLVAFDERSGRELWAYEPVAREAQGLFTSPEIKGKQVYWAAFGELVGLSAERGTVNWRQAIPGDGGYARPCLVGDTVCLTTSRGVLSYDARSGEPCGDLRYSHRMMGLHQPSVAVMGERLYIAHRRINNAGVLMCAHIAVNKILWQHDAPAVYHMSASEGTLIIRSQSVYALDAMTGKTRWKVQTGGCSPVANSGDCFYVLNEEDSGRLLRLDVKSGAILESHYLGGSCAGLVLEGSQGFFSDNKGVLHALDLGGTGECTAM